MVLTTSTRGNYEVGVYVSLGDPAYIAHTWTSAATYDPVVLVTGVMITILVRIHFLQRRQETASVQVLLNTHLVKQFLSLLLVATDAVGIIWRLILHRNEARVVLVEIWVKFELIWVIGARCSLTLDVGLHFVLMRDSKLLVGGVRSSNNNLSSARVASSFADLVSCLASTSERLLPSILAILRHDLALVGHGMRH